MPPEILVSPEGDVRLKSILTIVLLFLGLLGGYAETPAENKTALVIANADYQAFQKLSGPVGEAEGLKKALEQVGFQVTLVSNASREKMLDALTDFEKSLVERRGIAFFHYGGHAVQVAGKNYLIPVDADIPDERRVATRAVALDEISNTLDAAGSTTNILVLDACRNNPLPASSRAATRGLSVSGFNPKNSIIVYSAAAGTTAQDGVFTPALTKYLTRKDLSFSEIIREVRKDTLALTGGVQSPGTYDELTGAVYLAGKGPTLAPLVETVAGKSPESPPPALVEPHYLAVSSIAKLVFIKDPGNYSQVFDTDPGPRGMTGEIGLDARLQMAPFFVETGFHYSKFEYNFYKPHTWNWKWNSSNQWWDLSSSTGTYQLSATVSEIIVPLGAGYTIPLSGWYSLYTVAGLLFVSDSAEYNAPTSRNDPENWNDIVADHYVDVRSKSSGVNFTQYSNESHIGAYGNLGVRFTLFRFLNLDVTTGFHYLRSNVSPTFGLSAGIEF